MPFKCAKCRLCYYQDTMLLPQSKICHFWSIAPPANTRKKSFSSKRVLPNSFPIAAWLVGSTLLERKRHSNQKRGTHAPTHMLGSRFWSVNFASAQLCSRYIAQSFKFASFDKGLILCQQSLTRAKELPCSCHTSPVRALW